jgi:hypothetical protein
VYRSSRVRESESYEFRDLCFPEPDLRSFGVTRHLSSTLTLVVPQFLRHYWDITDRDSQRRGFFVYENPDFPIHDSSGSPSTHHYCLDGSDPIGKSRITISLCNGSTLLKSPMVKSRCLPRTLTRVLPRSMARIHSRDFENHKVSILRLNKNPDDSDFLMTLPGLLLCMLGLKPRATFLDLTADGISPEI